MPEIAFGLRREDRFSYVCHRCRRCCYGKRIPLTPYDLIRLAEAHGIRTGDLIRDFTEDGVFLRVRTDEAGEPCVFLGGEGCTVHSGRPGACRIYPLGRTFSATDGEGFCLVEPHPRTEGEYGDQGTIGDYLESQELEPYFAAAREYNAIFESILETFAHVDAEALKEGSPIESLDGETMLDVDQWVADYCSSHGLKFPLDPESKLKVHLAALREWLSGIAG